jgi:hypothetical protein
MQTSKDKTVESWDDVRNQFDKIFHSPRNRFPWHKGILPRYIDGSLSLHLRFVWRGIDAEWWGKLTANPNLADRNFKRVDFTVGNKRQSMFVNVYECLEQYEAPIPSLVRLHSFKGGDYRVGNFVIPSSRIVQTRNVLCETGLAVPEGEIGLVFANRGRNERSPRERSCNLPHDVIESATEVMKAISNDGGKPKIGMLGDVSLTADFRRIVIDGNGIRVCLFVFPDCDLEGIQMFLCPDDFESCSIEWVSH